jgi:hypothetical protein
MLSFGARAAKHFVRLVQSEPLEIRTLTYRVRSATEARPSGWPAKTFKTVIWKLTAYLRRKSIYLQFYESNCEAPEVQRAEHRILTPQAFFF